MPHDNWETPPDLFMTLDREFNFDLDAAASGGNALCANFITEDGDALVTPWDGERVFCNPPYSMLPQFVRRAYEESVRRGNEVIILIPAYTDTTYWWNYVTKASEIRFLKGRLRFFEGGRPGPDTARFPNAVVVFRPHIGNHLGGPKVTFWDWRAQ